MERHRDPSTVEFRTLEYLRGLFADAGLPKPAERFYGVPAERDRLGAMAFPAGDDRAGLRAMIDAAVEGDALGVGARRDGATVRFEYPAVVLVAEKRGKSACANPHSAPLSSPKPRLLAETIGIQPRASAPHFLSPTPARSRDPAGGSRPAGKKGCQARAHRGTVQGSAASSDISQAGRTTSLSPDQRPRVSLTRAAGCGCAW
jgi:hypothetical protein